MANKKLKSKRILAIDYGKKHIGLAISDSLHISIQPLASTSPKNIWATLENLQVQYNFQIIILGFPFNTKEGSIHQEISLFYKKLCNHFTNLIIYLVDESYSSQKAQSILYQTNSLYSGNKKSREKLKKKLDSKAAQVILYTFLQNQS